MAGPEERLPITAAVMAGGRSMRMGVDKTLLPLEGEPLVVRVVDVVREACARTVVVTNRPEALADAGLADDIQVLVDEVAYQGPLGGLATALSATRASGDHQWVLAVAADMPWVDPAVIRALWEMRDAGQAVVPVTKEGPEPLLALYHVDCLPAARRALATGRRRLVAIFGDVAVVEVPAERLREYDPDLRSLVNVNTPSDLVEVRDSAEVTSEEVARPSDVGGTEPGPAIVQVPPRGLPSERPVTVHMNDVEVATVQASPLHIEEMAVGFLLAEGLLADREAFESVAADYKRGLAWVVSAETVPDDMVHRKRYVTSGCGKGITFSSIGHARGLARIDRELRVAGGVLTELMRQMARGAEAYRDTGGTHACALARDNEVVFVREDVGRHNALDKVLGRAWLDRVPTDDAVLLTTGRISYEMAVKAAKSRVPIVVSRTAATDLAAQIADELGITLVGYCRGGKMTIYSHPERIEDADIRPENPAPSAGASHAVDAAGTGSRERGRE